MTAAVPQAPCLNLLYEAVVASPQAIQATPEVVACSKPTSNVLAEIDSTEGSCSGCSVPVSQELPCHIRVFKSELPSCSPKITVLVAEYRLAFKASHCPAPAARPMVKVETPERVVPSHVR